jgi:hypothetical protein
MDYLPYIKGGKSLKGGNQYETYGLCPLYKEKNIFIKGG